MPSVQIKNVPDEVHRTLRHRAVEAGQSLQEYLLARLKEDAAQPTAEELFARIRKQRGGSLSAEQAARLVREDRDSH